MSLRTKIVWIVTAVVVLYAAIDHGIQRMLISPSFAELERIEAAKNLGRVVEAIQSEQYHLDLACRDWASWDDTWNFVAEPDERFVRSNLGPGAFAAANLDLLYVCDLGGRVVWGDIRDLATGEHIALRDFPRERLAPSHALLPRWTCTAHPRSLAADPGACAECGAELHPVERTSGIVMTERGAMLVSSRPITTSDGTGPVRGAVILGRLLAGALLTDLERRTNVDFDLWPLEGGDMPERERGLLDAITASPEPVIEEGGEDVLDVYTTLSDIRAAPALLVRANVPRDITAHGASSIRYALISTVAAGLLLLLVLLGVMQRTVLKPIARLTAHAVHIGQSENPTIKLDLQRADEIGILSREFDGMMEKLAASRAAVVAAARAAGMSDIATGILHNVGNVLNSVNVSTALVGERLRASKLGKLKKLVQLADDHAADLGRYIAEDPRGKHFGPYLSEVARLLAQDEEKILAEIRSLESGVEHIRELVSSQQSYARRSELVEATPIAKQIESALQITQQAQISARPVAVEREFADVPDLWIDRHKLTEILVNLMRNALQSLDESGVDDPRMRLAMRSADGLLVLEVADNGVGIPAENLVRIFHHGFTTKKDGHGFGLHASANAAKELGGKLTAASDGPGRGATFRLELPLQIAQRTSPPSPALAA